MKKMISMVAFAAALGICAPSWAQDTAAPADEKSAATIVSPANGNVLRAGTKVPVKVAEYLTTKGKKLKVGQRIKMETAEAVSLNGHVVIPAGSPVVGELTEVRNKGMWGKSGRIGAQVLHVRVGDRQIRLSGTFDDKGVTGTAGVIAAVALIPVAGFFTTGTSAEILIGSAVNAFLEEDVTVAFPQPAAAVTLPVAQN